MTNFFHILTRNWLIILFIILTLLPVIILLINHAIRTRYFKYEFDEKFNQIVIKSILSKKTLYVDKNSIRKIFYIHGLEGRLPWMYFSYIIVFLKNNDKYVISFLNMNLKKVLRHFEYQTEIKLFPYIKNSRQISSYINKYMDMVEYFYNKYKKVDPKQLSKLFNEEYESLIPEAIEAIKLIMLEQSNDHC